MRPSFPLQHRRIAAPQAFRREQDRTCTSTCGYAFATCFFEISFLPTGSLYRDHNFEQFSIRTQVGKCIAPRVKACGYNIQPFRTIELLYGYNIY